MGRSSRSKRGSTYGDVRARRSRDSRLVLLAERSHRRRGGSQGFARLRRPHERSLGAPATARRPRAELETVNHDASTGEIIATCTDGDIHAWSADAPHAHARTLHRACAPTPPRSPSPPAPSSVPLASTPAPSTSSITHLATSSLAGVLQTPSSSPRASPPAPSARRPSLRRGISRPRRPRRHRPRVPLVVVHHSHL